MAYLEVKMKLNVPDVVVQPEPRAEWTLGPGEPHLMELLARRLGLNARVERRGNEGYLVWSTPHLPTEKELMPLYRRISAAVLEINREIDELRLIYKVITEEFGKEVTNVDR